MKIELPPLPYGDADLAPHISANTISFHYGKHHQTYVTKAQEMVKGTEFADAELEDIVKATYGKADKKGLFNNAAQAWNHAFYWKSLSPKGGAPSGKLLDRINKADTTVIMATHDATIVDQMRKRVIELVGGEVVRDQTKGVYGYQ